MFVIYITPFFTENTRIFLESLVAIKDVRIGIISQEPQEVLPHELRSGFAGHWRVPDCLSTDQLHWAAVELSKRHGKPDRILATSEHIQVQVAEVRERLDVIGMDSETARNFRDKDRMKAVFQKSGIPCARHFAAIDEKGAWDFIKKVGYPVCVKPIDGAATLSTFRVEDDASFHDVLRASGMCKERPLQIEEFVVGLEHSFETISIGGVPMWHSLTRYIPTPLDVVRNPWIQYRVILPREVDDPMYDDIREMGRAAIKSLGMRTGMTHMEWFRRPDGSIAISEVACRPPGVNIIPLINRANDVDFDTTWSRLMIFGEFSPPAKRKYAAGCAFLRGMGDGRVKAVHGLQEVLQELGDLVTDVRAPQLGQPKAISYEGEGYIIVRHPETKVVEQALERIVSTVRVDLM